MGVLERTDAGFSTQSAWDFASASKRALGLRDGDSGAQPLGSMCLLPVRAYVDVALENDPANILMFQLPHVCRIDGISPAD